LYSFVLQLSAQDNRGYNKFDKTNDSIRVDKNFLSVPFERLDRRCKIVLHYRSSGFGRKYTDNFIHENVAKKPNQVIEKDK
jgi:hypothetical protein